jgi:hypothetical protein
MRIRQWTSTLLPLAMAAAQVTPAPPAPALRGELERAVAGYFAAEERLAASALAQVVALARRDEALLVDVVRTKSFVPRTDAIDQRGTIDASYRFVAGAEVEGQRGNEARLVGPATGDTLLPLVVYVPDAVATTAFDRELQREGVDARRYVLLVPDEKRDNLYAPSLHEHRRHAGPLRDLLLSLPIDPDRVYMVGSGRGGHATWDVGLTCADRWAGIFPCNGGLVHEGGWKASGGVFLGNARCFATFLVFNTSFDHGIESCRYAVGRFREWSFRIDAQEEPRMRTMGIAEAMTKLAPIVRNAHPRRIDKRFNRLEHGRHYWLRALDRKPREWDPAARIVVKEWPKDPVQQRETVWDAVRLACGHVAGTILGNRVEITAHGTSRVRVHLDPELVDLAEPVTFVVNGKVVRTAKPTRQLEVMLQHVRETGDTSRLYFAFADLPVGP